MMKYFSYDPNGNGFLFHSSSDEAKKATENAFKEEKELASEGWNEGIEEICWGEIKQRVVECERRKATDEEFEISGFDEFVDCHIVDSSNGL